MTAAPKLPPREKKCKSCDLVNIYRTVCKKCDKDLYFIYSPFQVKS